MCQRPRSAGGQLVYSRRVYVLTTTISWRTAGLQEAGICANDHDQPEDSWSTGGGYMCQRPRSAGGQLVYKRRVYIPTTSRSDRLNTALTNEQSVSNKAQSAVDGRCAANVYRRLAPVASSSLSLSLVLSWSVCGGVVVVGAVDIER